MGWRTGEQGHAGGHGWEQSNPMGMRKPVVRKHRQGVAKANAGRNR